jgi:Sulfotransferase family
MTSISRASSIPGLAPPPVLIFFHIPKTGGVTMQAIFRRCFSPDEYFDPETSAHGTALWVRSTARMAEKFHKLPVERQRAVRCVVGEHIAMDVAGIFDRPSKFFTIVREPIDRVISSFYFGRTRPELPSYPYIKDMALEEYLDSRMGLDYDNHQVRMLSGCSELDSPWGFKNGRIHVSAPPVKRPHLELAKRNIEEHLWKSSPISFGT